MDDAKQTQRPAIGVVMKKEGVFGKARTRNGRPRLKVNFAVLLRLREVDNFGWSRAAKEYLKQTGQYISPETLERRYLEYKKLQSAGKFVIDLRPFIVKKSV